MDNNKYNPSELAHKWEKGTISPEEKAWFEQWYAAFNDEEVLISHDKYTTPHQIRDNIFNNISSQIDAQQRPVAKVINLWRSIAAAAVVLFVVGLGLWYSKNSSNNAVQQVLVSSKAGQHRQVSLPDGTKVWLSPATQISYPEHFGSKREVSLTGEAFFEVVHDTRHPFIISTGKLKTVVLGTSFNVRAYAKAKSAEVTVVSGKVGVVLSTPAKHAQQILVANQRSVYYPATGQLLKENYPGGAHFLDQRNGLYNFNGATIKAITDELQLQYGITISVDTSLTEKNYYGSLNTAIPLQQTLNKLCTVLEVKWKKSNGIYYLQ